MSGGTVDAGAGGLEAPPGGVVLQVLDVTPVLAAEEVLADVGHTTFGDRFSRGVTGSGGVYYEPAVARVILEAAGEDRVVEVGLGDGCLKVVEDDALTNSTEEDPGVLEAADKVWKLL